ncbi:hypothetical protein [Occallatibacter riparius]|uniref:Uncharacterized protein n=1 Tax=Occallatibacter riparius TaxID=1002689 RepID=A0A9J7BRJ8_9BACT|nr:hypothetical protein [Occallatibacter riparius]UWZ85199.1 hypothetical protein MOP44_04470 [Occallatibacter riparius]
MRKHDPNYSTDTNIYGGLDTYQAAQYLHQESLARVYLAWDCIRRSDAVLAQLGSVWICQHQPHKRP